MYKSFLLRDEGTAHSGAWPGHTAKTVPPPEVSGEALSSVST